LLLLEQHCPGGAQWPLPLGLRTGSFSSSQSLYSEILGFPLTHLCHSLDDSQACVSSPHLTSELRGSKSAVRSQGSWIRDRVYCGGCWWWQWSHFAINTLGILGQVTSSDLSGPLSKMRNWACPISAKICALNRNPEKNGIWGSNYSLSAVLLQVTRRPSLRSSLLTSALAHTTVASHDSNSMILFWEGRGGILLSMNMFSTWTESQYFPW
jgi:hypothetical protein